MRSKEVDEYIYYLKTRLSLFHNNYQFATEQAIEGVLNYISDLEKENKFLRDENNIYKNETVSKKKIRDKIKELDDYYKKEVYPIKYQWADIDITEFFDSQIELLNELLGE